MSLGQRVIGFYLSVFVFIRHLSVTGDMVKIYSFYPVIASDEAEDQCFFVDDVYLSRSVTAGWLIPCKESEFQSQFSQSCSLRSALGVTFQRYSKFYFTT